MLDEGERGSKSARRVRANRAIEKGVLRTRRGRNYRCQKEEQTIGMRSRHDQPVRIMGGKAVRFQGTAEHRKVVSCG